MSFPLSHTQYVRPRIVQQAKAGMIHFSSQGYCQRLWSCYLEMQSNYAISGSTLNLAFTSPNALAAIRGLREPLCIINATRHPAFAAANQPGNLRIQMKTNLNFRRGN